MRTEHKTIARQRKKTGGSILVFGILGVLILFLFSASPGNAQALEDWSVPIRLSSEGTNSSEGYMVADDFGWVHTFWLETLSDESRRTIEYARFDGERWSPAIDLFSNITQNSYILPFIDRAGNIHLMWSGGAQGPIFYSSAPIAGASNAQNWLVPTLIEAPSSLFDIEIDSQNVLHLVYASSAEGELGVYYQRSADGGETWEGKQWLDPGIPRSLIPSNLQFVQDDLGNLHVLWSYAEPQTGEGRSILYSRLLKGSDTWSEPFFIDEADDDPGELRSSGPSLITVRGTLYVIWAGDVTTHREYRFSLDRGDTWSPTERIFGELHGQAISDGVAVDALGRVHFLGQIRWPQGLYHSFLQSERWAVPTMVYLIARNDSDPFGSRIHAHKIRLVSRMGNQLVTTFTTAPTDDEQILYSMHSTLVGVPPIPVAQLPGPTQIPQVQVAESSGDAIETVPTPIVHQEFQGSEEVVVANELWFRILIPGSAVLLLLGLWWWRVRQ